VFVSLGNVVTQKRCGGWKNFVFTRHKFLLVTLTEWLKSVLNYRSYPQNKLGISFFGHNRRMCGILINSCKTVAVIRDKIWILNALFWLIWSCRRLHGDASKAFRPSLWDVAVWAQIIQPRLSHLV